MNIYEMAVKNKWRFNYKGSLNVEDLLSLSVKDLDVIYKGLNAKLKETSEDSLLEVKTKESIEITNKIQLVKDIVNEKMELQNKTVQAKVVADKKRFLETVLAEKERETMKAMTPEAIRKMLEQLG